MFKDLEDKAFAIKLFRQSLLKGKEYRERIDNIWELGNRTYRQYGLDHHASRLSRDFIVPDHSHQVTLNEYIDAAKYYSTPKSGTFINGILDSIVNELKKEKLLLKD